ncbi:mediator of RNA polymerase II transcription subunit 7-like protein [Dinothrombium tinctorium]|uniref:Mediator of RNA polymerase II transcription subunit 7 n=1 Tax=Dinothrombium tinctorium TaxID=1965070 RepID=A0A3S3P9E9_9ACAR|nr:mediator of RNA polymerase II transcription subunit 7-like protein [Dinothrombium tinctorium]RWS03989.1 mediator of RNA polymerase II transcription subunit 7-like protein [Dinothrombium tinctorium]RWS04051.1 mediator of RNA polymerase II transcription subunit 7-like protein [Dinothrombium tinctorium]
MQSSSSQPSAVTISCSYPLPPSQYYTQYTDENVARGRAPEPPRPLTEGNYSMFGQPMTNDDAIIRPLEMQGIKRLYPRDYDHKRELKKMNASILVNFLDLIDVLVKCPDTAKREEKCSDIAMLFVQMHHLINELRPHQARETIRVTLQCQKRQRVDIITRLNKQIDRVNDIISSCINNIPDANDMRLAVEDIKIKSSNGQLIGDNSSDDKKLNLNDAKEEAEMNELDSIMCSIIDEI